MRRIAWITADARRIFVARGLRSFSYGFISITLGLYLAHLGLTPFAAGAVFTAALLGAAGWTLAVAALAERVGRRRMLQGLLALMMVACVLFAVTDNLGVLLLAAFTGTLSPNSNEGGGPFVAIEQAILPQTAADNRRTRLFVLYNLLGSLAGAFGGLFAGLVAAPTAGGDGEIAAYRALFGVAAVLAGLNLALCSRLSPAVERAGAARPPGLLGVGPARGTVLKLSALFGLDSAAGGFTLQSIVAFWFAERWGLGLDSLGPVFFWVNVLNALSYLLAERIARRVGLLNTIVFTHLPASVMLLLVPLMPSVELAILVFVGRQLLSQMDIPTRQSYTMAVVPPEARVAAASFTGLARSLAQISAPLLAGSAMTLSLGAPFLVSGGLKVVYDLAMYGVFRNLRPPEEVERLAARQRS